VSYIYSRVLRPSDVINDFVFKDKDLGPMAKDFNNHLLSILVKQILIY